MLIVQRPRTVSQFDRAFQQLANAWFTPPSRAGMPDVDAEWNDGTLVLGVDLPGVPREAVSVKVADRTLTIEVDHENTHKSLKWSQTVDLTGTLDPDQVTATYADGRLVVTVPPARKPEARAVTIEVGATEPAAPSAIETGSSES
jgi:HSP20 family molecular chaperone IbpA